MIRNLIIVAATIAALGALAFTNLAGAADRQGQGLLKTGSPAPNWTMEDADGKRHSLADYQGQVVVMDFWATWCGPCIKAMPGLQRLHDKYGEENVKVIGVNTAENEGADPAGFMKKKKYTYQLLLDSDNSVASTYQVRGIPAFYVVSGDGTIVYSAVGYSPDHEKELEKVIKEEVAKSKRG